MNLEHLKVVSTTLEGEMITADEILNRPSKIEYCITCGASFEREKRKGMTCSAQCTLIFEQECTCSTCSESEKCPYAFDYYNTDGDCLASK